MAYRLLLAAAAILCSTFCSCSTSSPSLASAKVYHDGQGSGTYFKVKTTAYSHMESDSLKYGTKNAAGGQLEYGMVRSAAADWSVFPLGTVFKIEGTPYLYKVDDYGRALVGTKTIDLYKPSMDGIKDWGARDVTIKVIKWGSDAQSLNVLKERQSYAHVRAMIDGIRKKS